MTENDRETMMTERQDDTAAQAGTESGSAEPVVAGESGAAEATVPQPTVPQAAAGQPDTTTSGAGAPTGTAAWASYAPSAPATRAPIRWGGVVWGILLTLFAGVTLYVLASAGRAAEVAVWLRSLTPGSAWALAAAALGLIIVVSALLGGIRASQRRRIHPRL